MIEIINSINNEKNPKGLEPKLIIVHHTASTASDESNVKYLNKVDQISCHFMVGQSGKIWQVMDLDRIAYHAGVDVSVLNLPLKNNSLNWCSIGIEVNSDGYNFTDVQRKAVEELIVMLMKQYQINSDHVLRHADIAPDRKWDIGENFYKKHGIWAAYQKHLHNIANPNEVSMWAREAMGVAEDLSICKDQSNPQEIIGTTKLAWVLYNMGLITKVSEDGVSLEQFITALNNHNLLKKYE